MKYKNIRPLLKTGDVIAFSGKGRVSNIIKWKTGSPISHVGMVFQVGNYAKVPYVLLIESTTLVDLPDAVTGETIKGVQLQIPSQRIETYNGNGIWLYPLKQPLSQDGEKAMVEWLRRKHYERTPYDSTQAIGSALDVLESLFPWLQSDPDFCELFCSELVTKALQVGQVLDKRINASEMTPADVIAFDCFSEPIEIEINKKLDSVIICQ